MDGLVTGAGQEILKTGLLGAIIVILGGVIWVREKRLVALQDKFIDVSVKMTSALVENAAATREAVSADLRAADANQRNAEAVRLLTDRLDRGAVR